MNEEADRNTELTSPTGGSENPARKRHVADRIYIRDGEYRRKCFYSEILWVEADRCNCYIYRKGKSKLLVILPLAAMEKKLPSACFMRVHRSYIINIYEVDSFVGNAVYIGKEALPVSRRYRAELYAAYDFLESLRIEEGNCETE